MPPEPLPCDRKDFFKERKHDRSSESIGSFARWRDTSHHGSRDFGRWGSGDFRRPPGHAKQGGWHLYCEESGHGYVPSRSGDKMLEDESCRPCVSHGDGKYGRSSRENRGSFSQRDWKGHSWETSNGSPNTPGRLPDVSNNDQRSVDDMLSYPSHPPSDFVNAWDQLQLKDHHDKMGGVNGLGTGQRCDRENSLGSTDWKPLKWSRSGSLSSRGSGFSHSSSSKSMGGVDSNEAKTETQLKNTTPVQSPSGDAAACVTSAAPSEETTSRKKPRLGWGEGLAKYEKKKVEGPDVSVNKDGTVFSTSNTEPIHCLLSNLADKSPRVVAFSDCASPATPSSVACSSSPGAEEKSFGKTANVDNEISNLCVSPSPGSQNHLEGFPLNLEKLDVNSIANLGSLLIEWLHSDDPSSVESSFVRCTAMNKLLFCKGEISKTLEVTESEIDLLEIELKSLKSESESSYACPASSSSLPMENNAKSCKEHDAVSNLILRPTPLQVVSSADTAVERMPLCDGAVQEVHADVKDEDIDSPGTATSKFVEPLSLVKVVSSSDTVKDGDCSGNLDAIQSTKVDVKFLMPGLGGETTTPVSSDVIPLTDGEDISCDSILAFNRECANRSYEVFNKLLPRDQYVTDVSRTANFLSCQNNSLIKEKFVTRKQFLRFKERVISLKFRAFQHLWKEDMRLLSVRKHRAKSHKKFELSLRTTHTGNQKHRSSIRSRFSSPAGNLSLVPTTEIINFTSKLLSDSQVKPYRSALKMPALILDKKEKMVSWFISSNGLVEDPCAVEKERAMINLWMPEEKETFMDKLATYGKDFKKIASFLEHKTTADCVEFYYKNHKSDCFEKTKKKLDCSKQPKSFSTSTYLVTSGKKWNREVNAASLDMLGAASVMAAHADDRTRNRPTCAGGFFLGGYSDSKTSWFEDSVMERSSSLDIIGNERETVAADVLAGICGSLSSEAMSSCITSSVDPGEGYREWKCQKVDSVIKRPLTPDVTQVVDYETCSDESCGEMDPADWTDEEKSIFIQAVSSYGKDFAKISRCVRTRSRDQCKVFFSKARKCLGLDVMHPESRNVGTPVSDDANGGRSDTDDACVVETGSVICGNTSGCKMGEDSPLPIINMTLDESDPAKAINLQIDLNRSEENNGTGHMNNEDFGAVETLVSEACQTESKPEIVVEGDSNIMNGVENQSESVHAEKIVAVLANQSASVHAETIADVLANQSESLHAEQIADILANTEAGRDQMIEQGISVAESVSVGEAIDPGPSSSDALVENKVVAGVSSEGCRNDLEGQDLLLPKSGSVGCRKFSEVQSLSQSDSNISTQYMAHDCYLQKCSSSKSHCSVAELPLLSRKIEQTSDHSIAHSRSLSDTDKPCRNGDVKLFGQILTHPSSIHKSNSSTHEIEEQEAHSSKLSSKLCNLKFSGHHNADGNSALMKFDRNNFSGLENLPYKRSYGFWDGNRIQTGLTSLPDSALLLAKYPAAFSNFPTPSSKIEQQPLQAVVKSNERNLNGVSVFPTRELSSSNGVVDYQVYRSRDSTKLQPFTVDMKQRQDILSEMQRRNGFEAVSSLQPQGRGVVGMNVVGRAGILVGGQCTGVSDPVAAIKMHYAKSDQYGGQTGSIIREEESWRGKGDIGR